MISQYNDAGKCLCPDCVQDRINASMDHNLDQGEKAKLRQEREDRIVKEMKIRFNNPTATALETTRGYCEAFVDGMMAIEEKAKMVIEDSKLMTRKEAEAKLKMLKAPRDISGSYMMLDILDALGLIKFKEEEKLESGLPVGFQFPWTALPGDRDEWAKCCKELRNQGFDIVRRSK